MVTDTQRESYAGERDLSAPAALAFGGVLVVLGIAGFFALGSGVLLGAFQVSMPFNIVHLGAGTVLWSAGILGSRAARLANLAAAVLFLTMAIAGLAGIQSVAPNSADTTLDLVLGLVLLAVGRR